MRTIFKFWVVVLLWPKRVAEAIALLGKVIAECTRNAFFPNPSPSLAELQAAKDNLEQAQTAKESRAPGSIDKRDEMMAKAKAVLKKFAAYVQGIANDNLEKAEEIIHSAGFKARASVRPPKPLIDVRQGKMSGEVVLRVKRVGHHVSYEWQYSTDEKAWINAPPTMQSKTTIRGLTPGVIYYFRFRAVTKDGPTEWSQIVSIMVK